MYFLFSLLKALTILKKRPYLAGALFTPLTIHALSMTSENKDTATPGNHSFIFIIIVISIINIFTSSYCCKYSGLIESLIVKSM